MPSSYQVRNQTIRLGRKIVTRDAKVKTRQKIQVGVEGTTLVNGEKRLVQMVKPGDWSIISNNIDASNPRPVPVNEHLIAEAAAQIIEHVHSTDDDDTILEHFGQGFGIEGVPVSRLREALDEALGGWDDDEEGDNMAGWEIEANIRDEQLAPKHPGGKRRKSKKAKQTPRPARKDVFSALGRELKWNENALTKEMIADRFGITDQKKVRRLLREARKFFTL